MGRELVKVKQDGIFSKIKKFLNRLLKKEEVIIQEVNYEQNENVPNQRQKFTQEIKVETNDELKRLQYKLKSKQIEISDLTVEQKDGLIELYLKQIKVKKEKLLGMRAKIQRLKKVEGNI